MHEGKESLPLALKALRLSGMGKVWQEFAHRGRQENWTLEKYLSVLCDHELDQKEQNQDYSTGGGPLDRAMGVALGAQIEN